MTATILLVEPYHTGSHAAWAEGYAAHSRQRVDLLTLPGRFWKWRMHGGALTLGQRLLASDLRPDLILASDMLDLAAFLALTRGRTAGIPAALYFHENQLDYPARPVDPLWDGSRPRRTRAAGRDQHYPFINYTGALVADAVLWNSAYNRDSFLQALPGLLKGFPDFTDLHNVAAIRQKSQVLPLGLDLAFFDAHRPAGPRDGPPLILWNHRWEYDKGPREFFAALEALLKRGQEFQVAILGESFRRTPVEFLAAREWLGERLVHFGYAKNRADYAQWLWRADLVVSCAHHEFFGVSVVEAMYCDTWPLLPRRLVYPELIPDDQHDLCLFDDGEDLVERLVQAINGIGEIRQRSLREVAARYAWQRMASHYDDLLEEVRADGVD